MEKNYAFLAIIIMTALVLIFDIIFGILSLVQLFSYFALANYFIFMIILICINAAAVIILAAYVVTRLIRKA